MQGGDVEMPVQVRNLFPLEILLLYLLSNITIVYSAMWPWKNISMYSQNRKRKSNHIFHHRVPLHLSCSNIFKLTSSVRNIEMSQMFSLFSDEELWNAGCTAWNQKKASQGERQPPQSQSTITITTNNHSHNHIQQ